jgi:hypothetical protein
MCWLLTAQNPILPQHHSRRAKGFRWFELFVVLCSPDTLFQGLPKQVYLVGKPAGVPGASPKRFHTLGDQCKLWLEPVQVSRAGI